MTQSRRVFLKGVASSAAAITIMPYAARAAGHSSNVFSTPEGAVTVHPVSHASFVMETPMGVLYVDPVGDTGQYSDLPAPDLVLVTHEHGDHYNADTLEAIMSEDTQLITNPAVRDMLPESLSERAVAMANGDMTESLGITIDAIPAYNTTEGRQNFHPKGRDNGYVLTMGDFRVYVSGDTEGTPEMRALENIDVAFVCMNMPFTMEADAAADAVNAFRPAYVYPYHYRGRDNGTQDPAEFADLVEAPTEVKIGDWYEPDVI